MPERSLPTPSGRASRRGVRPNRHAEEAEEGRRGSDAVDAKLAEIPHLPRAILIERWTEAYGHSPPKGLSRRLLEYAAAYQVQVQAYGGLSPSLRRTLQRIAKASPREKRASTAKAAASKPPSPGTRLIREWHGRVYTIEALEKGFECDGRRYRSLSEVARYITGARWSGPRFFGT